MKNAQLSENLHPKLCGKKKTYGDYCCVPGCSNQRGKDKGSDIQKSYFRFPKDEEQKSTWTKMIRRDYWEPRPFDRISSDHFEGCKLLQGSTLGDTISSRDVSSSLTGGYLFVSKVRIVAYLIGIKQTSPTEKGYTPTLFPYQKKTPARKTSNSTKQEIQVIDG
ncbi:unnamed protein product [Mytilus coruscus]|uniref:THAP-type domain-containing protein n=1 Tax=Mytilus coruscus TaxID=42192 RepID=A0A6J8E8B7_MYTCO|nr:unnamed protein product [Mytilus coruscus]